MTLTVELHLYCLRHIGRSHISICPYLIGDSAGGTLAASTTLKLRDMSSLIKLKYQVLLYPMVEGLNVDLPSHQINEWHTFHFLKQKTIAEFTTMYVGKL